MACFKVKRHEKIFIKNGGIVLKELVALCNGRSHISISDFSANELLRATNNYDQSKILGIHCDYQLFKGFLNNRPIIVKRYNVNDKYWENKILDMPYKDIVIGSQMSVHKNILKVIGNCLETEHPIIVYEFAGTKILSECISSDNDVKPLTWKCRLKIAADLANAIAYLHTAFARPIIHRDINSQTIILDENNIPKLIDFGLCISIPQGQSRVEDVVRGRTEFTAPEYCVAGYLTEKVDVFLFGALLFELLSGQRLLSYSSKYEEWNKYSGNCVKELREVMDPNITHEGIEVEQLLDFAILFARCISYEEEMRPTMMDVRKELKQIYQTFPSPC